ncbi:aryl-alcohol dehydrogenase-like predicted oxidoreductase [Thermocatellispora tengchongensis]|uniref:Aryl-alcohol dehydrogenase-like predicted oxidoreductase n=1 Tax=Thermocatellispora tengchongensis TaxID=1073253 RepID=A0A840PDP2_9ACTN|nr:aldo/keto reductase [Thermocatellispora tengchongensis]MBB5135277.1 aryl-alcohol dehydrogenase-like predicted oxidoreductase [Thermocatellispora tengchongensis]
MEYALLGPSGVRVSRLCLGTSLFGVAPEPAEAVKLVHAALDHGVNFVDTADSYGDLPHFDRPGVPPHHERESAEEILGRALRGRREQVVLSTKAMEPVGPGPNDRGLSRRHLMAQLDRSLRRLGTDHVDLFHAHHPDPDTPLDQTLAAFDDMIRQGKVRYAALSTYPAWQVTHALWICAERRLHAPVAVQTRYNLFDRTPEQELIPACRRFGLSLTAFSPLGGGLLAGPAKEYSGERRWGGGGFTAPQLGVAAALRSHAAEWGLPPAHLALAWVLSRPTVASAIIGPESVAELLDALPAAGLRLEPAQLAALTAIESYPKTADQMIAKRRSAHG